MFAGATCSPIHRFLLLGITASPPTVYSPRAIASLGASVLHPTQVVSEVSGFPPPTSDPEVASAARNSSDSANPAKRCARPLLTDAAVGRRSLMAPIRSRPAARSCQRMARAGRSGARTRTSLFRGWSGSSCRAVRRGAARRHGRTTHSPPDYWLAGPVLTGAGIS